MNPRQIDRFFRILDRELGKRARVILTGASAASLWGSVRPSQDIDFGIILTTAGRKDWVLLEEAVGRTVQLTGIQANYTEDIDRWGAITLLDYRRHTLPYKRFGRLDVRLLDPLYWTIGKLTRYLDPDVQDLVTVLKSQPISPDRLTRLWAQALRKSPRSDAGARFRRQVEHFLRTYGNLIWGAEFDASSHVDRFARAAGLTPLR